jgi:predicted metallopeptidase
VKTKPRQVSWDSAPDIKKRVVSLAKNAEVDWLSFPRVFTYRSFGSKTRTYARTWGLPRLWQKTLNVDPAYIIEVISEHFDKLSETEQDKILLHEIMHIPKNFSGALTPHIRRGKRNFHRKVSELVEIYLRNK